MLTCVSIYNNSQIITTFHMSSLVALGVTIQDWNRVLSLYQKDAFCSVWLDISSLVCTYRQFMVFWGLHPFFFSSCINIFFIFHQRNQLHIQMWFKHMIKSFRIPKQCLRNILFVPLVFLRYMPFSLNWVDQLKLLCNLPFFKSIIHLRISLCYCK